MSKNIIKDTTQKDIFRGSFENTFELKGNNSFHIFRKTALLSVDNISVSDVLEKIGINEVYVYGFGEIGEMLYKQLKGTIKIAGIIDRKKEKYTITPEEIINNEIPIIITPASYIPEITYDLIKMGIKRERIISLNVLLELGMSMLRGSEDLNFKKQFLITGAQFENKGAQAMLFVATSEIRRLYPDAIIWYVPVWDSGIYSKEIQERYRMEFLLDGIHVRSLMFEILPLLTAIVDVSGYAFSSYWENEWYYTSIRAAYYYDVPLYIMPQSYGPFNFTEDTQKELKKILSHASVIYARERQGLDLLEKTYGLKNIKLSKDMVLQNKNIYLQYLYTTQNTVPYCEIKTKNNVAIVPNVRNYEFGKKEEVLALYERMIKYLIEDNRNIYIVSHSGDIEICIDIYKLFEDNIKVHLYGDVQDCIEYSMLIQNFDYAIVSRYHGIIHAYKEGIPCISIGWAEKYRELLESFDQEKYVFDVRDGVDEENLMLAIKQMNNNFEKESEVIREIMPTMQQENCFDILSELKVEE